MEDDPDGLGRRVRVEMFKRFGYFPTESSEHSADLLPWSLPHGEQGRRFRIPVPGNPHPSERNLASYAETPRNRAAADPPWPAPAPELRRPDVPPTGPA